MTDAPMIYIGIDPGVGGGIAMINECGVVLTAMKMPATERDLLEGFNDAFIQGRVDGDRLRPCRAVLERVGASPQMGVVSAFTFGKGYGALLMALTAARIPFDQVAPAKWQQAMGCRSGGDKNVTKRRVVRAPRVYRS